MKANLKIPTYIYLPFRLYLYFPQWQLARFTGELVWENLDYFTGIAECRVAGGRQELMSRGVSKQKTATPGNSALPSPGRGTSHPGGGAGF